MSGNGVMWSLFMPEDGGVKAYCKETFQLSKPYGEEHLYLSFRLEPPRDPADWDGHLRGSSASWDLAEPGEARTPTPPLAVSSRSAHSPDLAGVPVTGF